MYLKASMLLSKIMHLIISKEELSGFEFVGN